MEHREGNDALFLLNTGMGVMLCLVEHGELEGSDAMAPWNTAKGVMLCLIEHGEGSDALSYGTRVSSDDLSHGTRGQTERSVPTCCANTVSLLARSRTRPKYVAKVLR